MKFKDTSLHFDHDLDAILDRVYSPSSKARSALENDETAMRRLLARREQGSQELKQALAELRDRREKSQSVMRMKEEMTYLQDQIRKLKQLSDEIATLRQRLSDEEEQNLHQ